MQSKLCRLQLKTMMLFSKNRSRPRSYSKKSGNYWQLALTDGLDPAKLLSVRGELHRQFVHAGTFNEGASIRASAVNSVPTPCPETIFSSPPTNRSLSRIVAKPKLDVERVKSKPDPSSLIDNRRLPPLNVKQTWTLVAPLCFTQLFNPSCAT